MHYTPHFVSRRPGQQGSRCSSSAGVEVFEKLPALLDGEVERRETVKKVVVVVEEETKGHAIVRAS